ncbi:sensor histidine kinase [Pseudonocardiaceae bacterium YIM PH 21723]|nr:sensor histidine kinase [Pseudonocardiaceae bacterium YIM PH 21723]
MRRPLLLRTRLAVITALVATCVIAGMSTATWLVTEHNLRAQVDEALLPKPAPNETVTQPARPVDLALYCEERPLEVPGQTDKVVVVQGVQLIGPDGKGCAPPWVDPVVTIAADRTVTEPTLRDGVSVAGDPVRVLVRPVGEGAVMLTSRSLRDVQETLSELRTLLIGLSVLGLLVAGGAGLLLTRRTLSPLERLTGAAEHIARTEDLDTPIDVAGRDEVGRLGRAFATMTGALSESRRRQRELVTDAAHELRTPLTSLRTNVDLLAMSENSGRPIPADRRATVISSLQAQTLEFTELIGELVTLARDERELAHVEVDMATVIDQAVHRATSRTHGHRIEVDTAEWTLQGDATSLERAVLNLLDNAIKFSPPNTLITVHSQPGWITVTDQGPGVPEEHRTAVWGRFWRSTEARALPGSGLGLAIVADTIAAHGGKVHFTDPPTTPGATVRIDLPHTAPRS